MFIPETDALLDVMDRHGYLVWTDYHKLNLIGIRQSRRATDLFDDTFICLRKREGGWERWDWSCTTDPGFSQLKNGLAKGTAILRPDQYVDAWAIGYHKGQYEALVQVLPVTVFRDRNKDHNLDYLMEDTGLFGINIHRANAKIPSKLVGDWSAGCQVLSSPDDFAKLMTLAKEQRASGSPRFSYTLLEREDFNVDARE